MSKTAKKNIIGERFGILTVVSEIKERNKNGRWSIYKRLIVNDFEIKQEED